MIDRRSLLLAPLLLKAEPTTIRVGGREVTRLYTSGYPKPFLYPILAPDGTVLSRGWPIEPRPGDKEDHTWHRGIWWGHGDINGMDFWREQQGTASIRVDKVTPLGRDGYRLEQTLLTPSGESLASLRTTWRFTAEPAASIIDARIELSSSRELRFGDTDDGGFAVRLREEFREDRGAALINSEGGRGAKQIWGKPARWTDYSTLVDGKPYGVAILSHPDNLRHPAGWHARNYGLNSANPFAASSFVEEKGGQRGAYILPAGKLLRFDYRVIVHLGDATTAGIAARYEQYAKARTK